MQVQWRRSAPWLLAGSGLALAGEPSSFALRIDVQRMVPWDTWPWPRDGPVRALLQQGGQAVVLQPGPPDRLRPAGLTPGFVFSKALDAPGQSFELQLQRTTGPIEWPARRRPGACSTTIHRRWRTRAVR